ncbi:MAG: Dps family protein [Galactobacter sp.]|uniref:Dps family protein n=1 Tax=Galactobacter sp. TaxID=2676125 RepID=UPI0025C63715|nr:DNA starvation/stationary phase protection protein [Galactobacter sp.]
MTSTTDITTDPALNTEPGHDWTDEGGALPQGSATGSVGDQPTRLEASEHGFKAPRKLRDGLQDVLVDLINLHLVGKQAHWNIVGANFRDLHLNLDELVNVAREGADEIAERLRALHSTADGRPEVVATRSTLKEFPAGEIDTHAAIKAIVTAIDDAVGTMRRVHDDVDAADPTSADILHSYISQLEQQSWFIGAEIRTPSTS